MMDCFEEEEEEARLYHDPETISTQIIFYFRYAFLLPLS